MGCALLCAVIVLHLHDISCLLRLTVCLTYGALDGGLLSTGSALNIVRICHCNSPATSNEGYASVTSLNILLSSD
jgi:hypothetical protein